MSLMIKYFCMHNYKKFALSILLGVFSFLILANTTHAIFYDNPCKRVDSVRFSNLRVLLYKCGVGRYEAKRIDILDRKSGVVLKSEFSPKGNGKNAGFSIYIYINNSDFSVESFGYKILSVKNSW